MTDPAGSEYLEPMPQSRLGIGIAILAALLIGAALYHFSPPALSRLSAMPSLCEQLAGYRRWMQLFSAALPIPGLWLALYGRRILRSGQSPPPDAWVLHRVRIKRGPHVTRVGIALLVLGIAVTFVPLYFWTDQSRLDRASVAQVCEER
jgi:hypothetical protein